MSYFLNDRGELGSTHNGKVGSILSPNTHYIVQFIIPTNVKILNVPPTNIPPNHIASKNDFPISITLTIS